MTQNKVIHDLRKEIQESKKEAANLKLILDAERIEKEQISQILENLKEEKRILEKINNRNVAEMQRYRNSNFFDPVIPKKHYDALLCHTSKRKRRMIYWELINKSISRITECKNATVSLMLGTEEVHLQWTEKEMNDVRGNLRRKGFQIAPFPNVQREPEFFHPIAQELTKPRNKARLKKTFSQREVCKAVVTLDSQRISQPAYHEMRMELNSLMPPLSLVKEEKKQMSMKLPFYVMEEVHQKHCTYTYRKQWRFPFFSQGCAESPKSDIIFKSYGENNPNDKIWIRGGRGLPSLALP